MRNSAFRWLPQVSVCFWRSAPLMAHHSFAAEYDAKKPVTLKGIVTKVDWMNPHVYFYIDVEDEAGKVTNWGFEMGPPNGLQRAGWTKNTMKIGDEVDRGGNPRQGWQQTGQRAIGDDGEHGPETGRRFERRKPDSVMRRFALQSQARS